MPSTPNKSSFFDTYIDKAVTALNREGVVWPEIPQPVRDKAGVIEQKLTLAANKKNIPQYMKLVNLWRDTILKAWKEIHLPENNQNPKPKQQKGEKVCQKQQQHLQKQKQTSLWT